MGLRGNGNYTRLLLVFGLLCLQSAAQNSISVVEQSRQLAHNGGRAAALTLLKDYLATDPADNEARVLYGQALSWEGRYEEARLNLEQVLSHNSDHGDALPALINVELWSDHPARAAELAERGLRSRPRNATLLLGFARALRAVHETGKAQAAVERLLEIEPRNTDALHLRASLREEGQRMQASISQSADWFNDGTKPWLETQLSLKRETRSGSVIGRFSQAERFSSTSRQSEIEYYPRLRPGTYAYLAGAFSVDAELYPKYRLGAEVFQSAGKGYELSAGIRVLSFDDTVHIYTGSVGRYYGNWYFSIRTYLTPDLAGTSRSFQFLTRRYFGSSGTDYLGIRVGEGSSPIEARSVQDISVLHSGSMAFEWTGHIRRQLSWSARFGVSREDRQYRGRLLHFYSDCGLAFRF